MYVNFDANVFRSRLERLYTKLCILKNGFYISGFLIYLINTIKTTLVKSRLYLRTTLPKKKNIFDEKGKRMYI